MAASMELEPKQDQFTVVCIPADVNAPVSERVIEIPAGKKIECLIEDLQPLFAANGGSTDKAAQRAAIREQIAAKLPPGTQLPDEMLDSFMGMTNVDTVPLLLNKASTNWLGVYMYVDDQGMAKGLPTNIRASQIAMTLGQQVQVLGDAYIGMILDDSNDLFERLDFTIETLKSGDWRHLAVAEAKAKAAKAAGDAAGAAGAAPALADACAEGRTGCGNPGKLRCARCKAIRYCSSDCQKADWRKHKLRCKKAATS